MTRFDGEVCSAVGHSLWHACGMIVLIEGKTRVGGESPQGTGRCRLYSVEGRVV